MSALRGVVVHTKWVALKLWKCAVRARGCRVMSSAIVAGEDIGASSAFGVKRRIHKIGVDVSVGLVMANSVMRVQGGHLLKRTLNEKL